MVSCYQLTFSMLSTNFLNITPLVSPSMLQFIPIQFLSLIIIFLIQFGNVYLDLLLFLFCFQWC